MTRFALPTALVAVIASSVNALGAGGAAAPNMFPASATPARGFRPIKLTTPKISATALVGVWLNPSHGSWSPTPRSYAHKWKRCNSLGAHCAAMPGGSSSYALGTGDVAATLRSSVVASNAANYSTPAILAHNAVVTGSTGVQHLDYVFDDGLISVYDMDLGQKLVKTISLPQTEAGIRGATVAPLTHMLFISYGGDGGGHGNGSVLAYDLLAERVVWTVHLSTGIDSGQVSPDGKRLYMPTGENTSSGIWNVLNTSNGAVIGTIRGWAPSLASALLIGVGVLVAVIVAATAIWMTLRRRQFTIVWHVAIALIGCATLYFAGSRSISLIKAFRTGDGAHNTIVSNDGRYVYLGGRYHNYLDVYDTTTRHVRGIGPLRGGVRPFTVNNANTLAFTTATEFDGFQVSSVATGKVLFTVSFGRVPHEFPFSAPSHGVSLSPDEKQLYVIDSVNKEVHVYDVSGVSRGVAPTQLGVIPVKGFRGTESPCAYDCGQDGWLQHSLDGRFVYVGDSGEVIDTTTRKVLTTLRTLANTRKSLEIDWARGVPIATSGRLGVGHVG